MADSFHGEQDGAGMVPDVGAKSVELPRQERRTGQRRPAPHVVSVVAAAHNSMDAIVTYSEPFKYTREIGSEILRDCPLHINGVRFDDLDSGPDEDTQLTFFANVNLVGRDFVYDSGAAYPKTSYDGKPYVGLASNIVSEVS